MQFSIEHSHHPSQNQNKQQKQQNNDSSQQEQDHEHLQQLQQVPCHPHRKISKFDFSAIQQQIRLIREKKQAAKNAVKKIIKTKGKDQIYQSNMIEQILQDSMEIVPEHISLSLKQRMKFIQDKVYLSSGAQGQDYGGIVTRIKDQILSNQVLGNQLNLILEEIHIGIEKDIDQNIYDIHPIKRAKKQIKVQEEPAYRVKLKNMLIKSKIMDLKQQFNASTVEPNKYSISPDYKTIQYNNNNLSRVIGSVSQNGLLQQSRLNKSNSVRKQGQIWGDQFHILSEGTKKANQFIKKIQNQQKQFRKLKNKKKKQMQSLQVKSAMQHKQFEEQLKKQKHQSLKKRYEQTKKQKQAVKVKQQEAKKQFLNFLKEYKGKKPLFKVKQQQYMTIVLQEQQKRRKLKLQEIHEFKKPINHQQLVQHQKRYQKIRIQKSQQYLQQLKLKQRQIQNLPKQNVFRGRYHAIIKNQQQQKKNQIDPMIVKQQLLKKQKQFGQITRKKYMPHTQTKTSSKIVSESKSDLQNSQIKKPKSLNNQQLVKLGNFYMKQVNKSLSKIQNKFDNEKNQTIQQSNRYKDYLKQQKQNRKKMQQNEQMMQIRQLKKIINKNISQQQKLYQAKLLANRIQGRVYNKQQTMLDSINAKMIILKQFSQ